MKILLSDPALPVISITWGAFKSLNAQAIPQPIKFHLWEAELSREDLRENESNFYLEIQTVPNLGRFNLMISLLSDSEKVICRSQALNFEV